MVAKATLKSIAAEVGVSPMVVSAVARNDFSRIRVSAERKQQIERLIKQYNYVPSATAKSLQNSRTNIVNLFVPSMRFFEVPFYQKLLISLQHALAQQQYSVSFSSYREPSNDLGQEKLCDAGMFFYFGSGNDEALQRVACLPMPTLVFGHLPKNTLPALYLNNEQASFEMMSKVLELGYRRLLYITVFNGDAYNQDARRGLQRAVEEVANANLSFLNLSDTFADAFYNERLFAMGQQAAQSILAMSELPELLYFSSDTIALAAIQYLQSQGLRIPQDVAIVANGCDTYSSLLQPALTRVTVNPESIAQSCASRIVSLIEGKKQRPKVQSLAMELDLAATIKHN